MPDTLSLSITLPDAPAGYTPADLYGRGEVFAELVRDGHMTRDTAAQILLSLALAAHLDGQRYQVWDHLDAVTALLWPDAVPADPTSRESE